MDSKSNKFRFFANKLGLVASGLQEKSPEVPTGIETRPEIEMRQKRRKISEPLLSTWVLHMIAIGISVSAVMLCGFAVPMIWTRLLSMKERIELQTARFKKETDAVWTELVDLKQKGAVIPGPLALAQYAGAVGYGGGGAKAGGGGGYSGGGGGGGGYSGGGGGGGVSASAYLDQVSQFRVGNKADLLRGLNPGPSPSGYSGVPPSPPPFPSQGPIPTGGYGPGPGQSYVPQCPSGPPGMEGPQGLDGYDGIPGQHGQPGKDGYFGIPPVYGQDCVTCPIGPIGRPGIPGTPGRAGNPGRPGFSGNDGKLGEHAPGGPPGPGIPGPPGNKGLTGRKGTPGQNYFTGAGRKGPKGLPGIYGGIGRIGNPGKSMNLMGQPGTIGALGRPGTPGRRGGPGTPGIAGALGAPGNDAQYCPCPDRAGPPRPGGFPGPKPGNYGPTTGYHSPRFAPFFTADRNLTDFLTTGVSSAFGRGPRRK